MDQKKTKKDREREAAETKKEEKIEDKHHGTICFLHPSQPMVSLNAIPRRCVRRCLAVILGATLKSIRARSLC
jgi:hypothetical protein